MSDEIISLRTESVSAQNMRYDLAKFKLLTTAVLGSLAVGAGTTTTTEKLPYVIGLIPMVCIYIDLIADAKRIQILVIGAYLKTHKRGVFAEYERFCSELRTKKDVFTESYAFSFSTSILCIAIFLFGLGQFLFNTEYVLAEVLIEVVSGIAGLITSSILHTKTQRRAAILK